MNAGNAVYKKRGRAVTVAGRIISASTTSVKATQGAGTRRFHITTSRAIMVRNDTAVMMSVGDDNGRMNASSVFFTAVQPKLVPSSHASVCTRNHAHSPVRA